MEKKARLKEGQAEMSLLLPEEMLAELKEVSLRTEASAASLARRAIKEFLARERRRAEEEKAA